MDAYLAQEYAGGVEGAGRRGVHGALAAGSRLVGDYQAADRGRRPRRRRGAASSGYRRDVEPSVRHPRRVPKHSGGASTLARAAITVHPMRRLFISHCSPLRPHPPTAHRAPRTTTPQPRQYYQENDDTSVDFVDFAEKAGEIESKLTDVDFLAYSTIFADPSGGAGSSKMSSAAYLEKTNGEWSTGRCSWCSPRCGLCHAWRVPSTRQTEAKSARLKGRAAAPHERRRPSPPPTPHHHTTHHAPSGAQGDAPALLGSAGEPRHQGRHRWALMTPGPRVKEGAMHNGATAGRRGI